MHGTCGPFSSRGGQSRVGSFGARYGGAEMDEAGPTRNSSSIPITVINAVSGAPLQRPNCRLTPALPQIQAPPARPFGL
jgi:hypothetical protein